MTRNSRTNNVLAILLLISVGLNLFAAGAFVAGRVFHRPLETVMRPFPQALRDEIRSKLFEDRDALRGAIGELRAARRQMFELMRKNPLDEQALRDAMAEVRNKTAEVQTLIQNALLASLKETPAAERQKIEPPLGLGFGLGRLRGE